MTSYKLTIAFLVIFALVNGKTVCFAQAMSFGQLVKAGTGQPVPQYPVVAQVSGAATVSTSVTDTNGTFRFYDLPAGHYLFYPLNRRQATVEKDIIAGQNQQIGVILLP